MGNASDVTPITPLLNAFHVAGHTYAFAMSWATTAALMVMIESGGLNIEQWSPIMRPLSMTGVALAVAALAVTPTAAAAPTGGSPAADTVKWLRDQGYSVQVNGTPNGPLSQCIVTGVHGLRDSNVDSQGRQRDPGQHATVYVDVSCNATT